MMHSLAYTCMTLTCTKIHVYMTVRSILVTLIPLVGAEVVSRSYWQQCCPFDRIDIVGNAVDYTLSTCIDCLNSLSY